MDEGNHAVNVSAAKIHQSNKVTSFYQIVPVSIQIGGKRLNTYVFLESGSTVSFIDQSVHEKLHPSDAQNSWYTWNKGSRDTKGSSQNKGTTFKGAFNRCICTPVNLGQDAYELQRPLDYKTKTRSEPFAIPTELGWVVSGRMKGKRKQNICHFTITEDVKVAENI